ncbi:hypothetical protein, putative membrane protein [Bradyrhizobium sp. ORS 278]|uniref:hypothetical protein n=1 Tax=Bradyrhizobium sp. (strain ORS 278) TaxID=114615 RepID=UPI00015084CB|nr:hypothetical protein [Bradyrhizobium sp. ORS 278]CAL79451.1 hypothetical protein, putative membrane protein [Bradyrhizobium sp. ORS 278]
MLVRTYRVVRSPWDDPTLTSLFGSRLILIMNAWTLLLVPMTIYAAAYIVQGCRGYDRPQDAPVYVLPVIVMIVIRRQMYSLCFFVFYGWQLVEMLRQARNIHLGIHDCGDRLGDPVQYVSETFQ